MREAASAALAEAGYADDPRLRGAGHKIANAISQFLRSPLAEKPFVKSGKSDRAPPRGAPAELVLGRDALVHAQPAARARGVHRATGPLSRPASPKKAFVIQVGKRTVKPQHLLLGDPIDADAKGQPTDVPLALHYIELMARMGALPWAPVASKVLGRLLKDCDELGIWRPKNLRSQPKAINKITYHYYPLLVDAKTTEGREVDVTFRLATHRQAAGLVHRIRLTPSGRSGLRDSDVVSTNYSPCPDQSDPLRLHPHREPGLRGAPYRRAGHRLRDRPVRWAGAGQRLQRAGGSGIQGRGPGRYRAARSATAPRRRRRSSRGSRPTTVWRWSG